MKMTIKDREETNKPKLLLCALPNSKNIYIETIISYQYSNLLLVLDDFSLKNDILLQD